MLVYIQINLGEYKTVILDFRKDEAPNQSASPYRARQKPVLTRWLTQWSSSENLQVF